MAIKVFAGYMKHAYMIRHTQSAIPEGFTAFNHTNMSLFVFLTLPVLMGFNWYLTVCIS